MVSKPGESGPLSGQEVDSPHSPYSQSSPLSAILRWISHKQYIFFFTVPIILLLIGVILGPELALVVVTGFLYLALLFVNFDLKDIQRGQNAILEHERRPLIEIASLDLDSEPCKFRVSNFGNGYATGLSVVLKTVIPFEAELSGATVWRHLTRESTEEYDRNERTIPGNSECVLLEGVPHIGLVDETERSLSATEATRRLSDREIPRINFQLFLVYASSIGEVGSIPLTNPKTVEVNSEMTFQEVYRQSHNLGGYELDTFPGFDLSEIVYIRDAEELREPTLL